MHWDAHARAKEGRRPYRPWTMKEVQRLLALKGQGRTTAFVCRELGRGRSDVCRYWRRHGTPRARTRPLTERKGELLALHGQGLPTSEIARRMGADAKTLLGWLRQLGLSSHGLLCQASQAIIARGRKQARERRRRSGEAPPGVMRRLDQDRARAAGMGWPEVSSPRQARLLEALYQAPSTERELALASGLAICSQGQSSTVRMHLRRLRALGLVEQGRRPGKTAPLAEYRLSPWLLARKQEERGERGIA